MAKNGYDDDNDDDEDMHRQNTAIRDGFLENVFPSPSKSYILEAATVVKIQESTRETGIAVEHFHYCVVM